MDIKNRARENFPSILLTLLSIVQAIALEEIWHKMHDSLHLHEVSWAFLLGWLQIGLSFELLILIWLLYVDLLMRFRVTPTLADTILPFFVGLIELLMIDLAEPEKLGEWTIVLAVLLGLLIFISQKTLKRARKDEHNLPAFNNASPATKLDLMKRALSVVIFIAAGLWLIISRDTGYFALIVLIAICVRLTYTLRLVSRIWSATIHQR